MGITLGPHQYGKAETRVVRVRRSVTGAGDGDGGGDGAAERHEIRDLNVSVALSGDMTAVHLTGDNTAVLPTDSQKNTVYAFARKHGIASPEEFTGLREMTVLNSTGSEFWGYAKDEYTTLPETRDRVLATTVNAEWRHTGEDPGFDDSYAAVRQAPLAAFAGTHSRSLQQTLYAMGSRVLAERAEICEVRLSLPNKHHFVVDLAPFGLDNPNEVFFAADRPYGLIEGTVRHDDAA